MSTVQKLLETANKEIGYLEKKNKNNLDNKTSNKGNNNFTKYAEDLDKINFYNGKKQGYAWCDVFVDWCFVKTFGEKRAKELLCQPNKSLGASTRYSKNYYVKNNQYYKSNPKVGDQIFFKNKTSVFHTGLVYKVDKSYVYTIEGNTTSTNSVIANGEGVYSKKYTLNSLFIDGYGRPKYSKEELGEKDIYPLVKYVSGVDYEGLVVHEYLGGPDTDKLLILGTKVSVISENGRWSQIGENEWVYSAYLKNTKPDTKKVIAQDGLCVRRLYSIYSSKITVLKYGTIVQVFKTKNGWSKVSPDDNAWVSSKYIK